MWVSDLNNLMSFNHIHTYAYQNNIIETTWRCQLDNAFSKCSGTLVRMYAFVCMKKKKKVHDDGIFCI